MFRRLALLLTIVFSLGHGTRVLAHDLGAEVKIVKDRVLVRAYYDDGTRARNAEVRLTDADKKLVFPPARTDKNGTCTFPIPQPGSYLVVVNGGGGHLARVKFTVRAKQPESGEDQPASTAGETMSNSHSSPGTSETTPLGSSESSDESTTGDAPVEIVSDARGEEEFTRTPWLKITIGVGTIFILSAALLVAVRRRGNHVA